MLGPIYFENSAGQMEINFEALELKTCYQFVEQVKHYLSEGYKVINLNEFRSVTEMMLQRDIQFVVVTHIEDSNYADVSYFNAYHAKLALDIGGVKL